MDENIPFELKEEEKLLNILKSTDSNLKPMAFKRLSKIYRKKYENEFIYSFLENYNFNDIEDSFLILEGIFELFDSPINNDILNMRINRIYSNNKIMDSILLMLKYTNLQISALMILFQIFQGNPCRDYWANYVVDIFYNTKRETIEQLSGRIVLLLIKSEHTFTHSSFNKINSKVNKISTESSLILREIKRIWQECDNFTVDRYIELLKNKELYFIVRFGNQKFIKNNITEIEMKIKEISGIFIDLLRDEECRKAMILESILILLEISKRIQNELLNLNILESLYEFTESEDEDVAYLSIKTISRILSTP